VEEVRANTCPYCGSKYGIEFAGCESKCKTSVYLGNIVKLVAEVEDNGVFLNEDW
jgi:hypothetical protein